MIIRILMINICLSVFLQISPWTSSVSAAPLTAPEKYNSTSRRMEQFRSPSWKNIGIPPEYQKSSGNCSLAGQQTFDPTTSRMEFCNGNKKFSLVCGKSPILCSNSEKGMQFYDNSLMVMKYCNGFLWYYLGSVPGVPCCPTGYVPVAANSAAGTTHDFCVAKYHMKPVHNGTNNPVNGKNLGMSNAYYPESRAEDQPWGGVNLDFARNACNRLNQTGIDGNFHLITNAEWMTVAKSIENNPQNWSLDIVGQGHIPTGHSDGALIAGQDYLPANPINDNDGCLGTSNDFCLDKTHNDFWQKRTFVLDNGETIWDVAGNIYSWVDIDGNGGRFRINATPLPSNVNVYQINDAPLTAVYQSITPYLYAPNPGPATNALAFLPSNNYTTPAPYGAYYDQLGFGTIYIGNSTSNLGIFRGGTFNAPRLNHPDPDLDANLRHFKTNVRERRGGIYSAWLADANSSSSSLGFRCVYTPAN